MPSKKAATPLRSRTSVSVAAGGSFRLQITAPEGAGEVAIEAEDQQGNRTRHKVQLPAGR